MFSHRIVTEVEMGSTCSKAPGECVELKNIFCSVARQLALHDKNIEIEQSQNPEYADIKNISKSALMAIIRGINSKPPKNTKPDQLCFDAVSFLPRSWADSGNVIRLSFKPLAQDQFVKLENLTIHGTPIYAYQNTVHYTFDRYFKDLVDMDITPHEFIIPKDNTKRVIYVLGDMEGNIQMLFSWFKAMGLIDDQMKWVAEDHIYVICCGDQIDSSRSRVKYAKDDVDLAVPIFMDYMRHISKGKVINLLGNHELMNVAKDFRYVHDQNVALLNDGSDGHIHAKRELLLQYDGVLGRIFRRYGIVARFDNVLFSHAGITIEAFMTWKQTKVLREDQNYFENVDSFINDVNEEIRKEPAYNALRESASETNSIDNFPILRDVILDATRDDANKIGLVWTRAFHQDFYAPKTFQSRMINGFAYVIGHNKVPKPVLIRNGKSTIPIPKNVEMYDIILLDSYYGTMPERPIRKAVFFYGRIDTQMSLNINGFEPPLIPELSPIRFVDKLNNYLTSIESHPNKKGGGTNTTCVRLTATKKIHRVYATGKNRFIRSQGGKVLLTSIKGKYRYTNKQ
jgi:hypothetical protein